MKISSRLGKFLDQRPRVHQVPDEPLLVILGPVAGWNMRFLGKVVTEMKKGPRLKTITP
jgi:hypothetical protein